MSWFGIHFTGVGRQQRQREESLARLGKSRMHQLEQAYVEQSQAAASVKDAIVEQNDQTSELRQVIKGVVQRLQAHEKRMNLRRGTA